MMHQQRIEPDWQLFELELCAADRKAGWRRRPFSVVPFACVDREQPLEMWHQRQCRSLADQRVALEYNVHAFAWCGSAFGAHPDGG
jgi:hypothetical protein